VLLSPYSCILVQVKLDKAAQALEEGRKLTSAEKRTINQFEKVMGVKATSSNLSSAASSLALSNMYLRAGAGSGVVANLTDNAGMAGMGLSPNALAAAPVGGQVMYVNGEHGSFSDKKLLSWAATHESHHSAGLRDVRIGGDRAYKFTQGGTAFNALAREGLGRTLSNPDHLTDLAQ
jgi:hypothetical protein